jgi:putative ABC transport system permease protein
MWDKITCNFHIAFEAVIANKLRSLLTALGIIFGVAAVIAMLAIGNGAQQEILEQIKLVGANNIVIMPIVEQTEEAVDASSTAIQEKKKFSPGLTLQDVQSIATTIPGIKKISPEIILDTYIIKSGIRRSAKLVGVEPSYFELTDFKLLSGDMFNKDQMIQGDPVCIIGKSIQNKFFSQENPIGKRIKVGPHWLEIIGVLEERIISENSIKNLGIRDFNMDVYTPVQSFLIRYKNRSLVTGSSLVRQGNDNQSGPQQYNANYHQIDRLVVQVSETELLNPIAEIISRMLKRRHYEVVDYEITIPELLLKQQQRTNQIFNVVLGAIAGISLIVGGIGIMNIMLASVLERIKEIGLRMALGAQKRDIILQFLLESMMISISGGLAGILLGIGLAIGISRIAEIPTIITLFSIIVSFGVAATIGLVFGIAPARKAAHQDPITSLRYE